MTTNQTIDGAPREPKWSEALLKLEVIREALTSRDSAERLKNMDAGKVLREGISILKELRALLDAKSCGKCSKPTTCGKMLCEDCCYETPSAQPQGEPVEIGYIEHSREFESEFAPVINRLIWTMPPDQRHKIPQRYKVMLYAEQPAPVAVSPICCGSCPGGCTIGTKP